MAAKRLPVTASKFRNKRRLCAFFSTVAVLKREVSTSCCALVFVDFTRAVGVGHLTLRPGRVVDSLRCNPTRDLIGTPWRLFKVTLVLVPNGHVSFSVELPALFLRFFALLLLLLLTTFCFRRFGS